MLHVLDYYQPQILQSNNKHGKVFQMTNIRSVISK